jgi:hypothetical protein
MRSLGRYPCRLNLIEDQRRFSVVEEQVRVCPSVLHVDDRSEDDGQ